MRVLQSQGAIAFIGVVGITALLGATRHIELHRVVTVSRSVGYCGSSPLSIDDSFPGRRGKIEDVVGIATVRHGESIVGWIYRTKSGTFYVQSNNQMPVEDQRVSHTLIYPQRSRVRLVSAIVPIFSLPWKNLTVHDCRPSDFKK